MNNDKDTAIATLKDVSNKLWNNYHYYKTERNYNIDCGSVKELDVILDSLKSDKVSPVEALISAYRTINTGIEHNQIGLTLRKLIGLEKKKSNSLYQLARELWKIHSYKFSNFERSFVTSIGKQLASGKDLSDKQYVTFSNIYAKYSF